MNLFNLIKIIQATNTAFEEQNRTEQKPDLLSQTKDNQYFNKFE